MSCTFAGVLRTAISGGVGGMALWAAVFPADVVKSRMQVTGSGRFSHMFVSILKNEGINEPLRFVRNIDRGSRQISTVFPSAG